VWGRVYLDGLRVLNIIRKTRPYRPFSGRVSPTIHASNQPSGKPAPTQGKIRGRVYIDGLRVLNIIRKTRPYRLLSGRVSPIIHASNQPSGKPAPTKAKNPKLLRSLQRVLQTICAED
jgi:DNA repair protein RadC